jgi:hypothetical protein
MASIKARRLEGATNSRGGLIVMSQSVKIREQRVRRVLARNGMRLRKSRTTSPEREYYGPGYMILDERNDIREGGASRQYETDLRGVEWFAFAHSSEYGAPA